METPDERKWDSSIDVDVTDHYDVDYASRFSIVLMLRQYIMPIPAFRTRVESDVVLISLDPNSIILQELFS